MTDKTETTRSPEARVAEMNENIESYQGKLGGLSHDLRSLAEEQIKDIVARKDALIAKLGELKSAGSDAVEDAKVGLDMALDDALKDLGTAWDSIRERLDHALHSAPPDSASGSTNESSLCR